MSCYRLYELCKKSKEREEKAEYDAEKAREKVGRFWEDENFSKYIEHHGEHFSDSLAEYASNKMENAHGEAGHHWSVQEVRDAFEKLMLKKPDANTWGDVAYAANMAYADYYGESLTTEVECLKQAHADVADPDGYPGKVFNRWLSDVMGKGEKIEWNRFL